ncbi:MAG: hypothetical protein J6K37_04635 [Lachnospiraceae bacterium]|nr:hypothetical protein [Lachnospiraceae bacterium]
MKQKIFGFGILIIFILGLIGGFVFLQKDKKEEQNFYTYFLEYENEYEKEDSIIYEYNTNNAEVNEIGKVKGYLYNCILNDEAKYIVGLLSEDLMQDGFSVVCFDLASGEVETVVTKEKIGELIENGDDTSALLYDKGEKILIAYMDENGEKWWLFYDITTEQQKIVAGDESGTEKFLEISNGDLWYIANNVLYRYNLDSQEKGVIMEPVSSAAIAETAGQIAYIRGDDHKNIYLYDINTESQKRIVSAGWNVRFDDLHRIEANWSNDGDKLFYIKSFPGFFNATDTRLMYYDVNSSKSYCIYKMKNTQHGFRYIQTFAAGK